MYANCNFFQRGFCVNTKLELGQKQFEWSSSQVWSTQAQFVYSPISWASENINLYSSSALIIMLHKWWNDPLFRWSGANMWANMRKRWLMKQMLYGFGTLFLRPIKTLRGECQSFGVSQFLCNITSMASSLEIELVSFYLQRVIYSVWGMPKVIYLD